MFLSRRAQLLLGTCKGTRARVVALHKCAARLATAAVDSVGPEPPTKIAKCIVIPRRADSFQCHSSSNSSRQGRVHKIKGIRSIFSVRDELLEPRDWPLRSASLWQIMRQETHISQSGGRRPSPETPVCPTFSSTCLRKRAARRRETQSFRATSGVSHTSPFGGRNRCAGGLLQRRFSG